MAVIRLSALESLAAAITCAVPELDGHVCVGVPLDSHPQTFPSLAINAIRWRWDPAQADQVATLSGARQVLNVGAHEATVQLRVLASTPAERDELAEAVVGVFLAAQDDYGYDRPGILVTDVTDCPGIPFRASWELEEDEWINLAAFERKYEALISCTGIIPALVTRRGVYTINDLRLGITHDLEVSVTPATMAPPTVEVVRIAEDGTLETL